MQPEGAMYDDEDRKRNAHINRSDVAQGLLRIAGLHILDDKEKQAPCFAFASRLQDKTSLDRRIQSCLWALHTTLCMLQKGQLNGAYMSLGNNALKCIMPSSRGTKPVIVNPWANDDSEQDWGNVGENMPEISIQTRILQASDNMGNTEFYCMVIAESPLAFSLRKAVAESLKPGPHKQVDTLRKVWNELRNHVRLGQKYDEDAAAAEMSVLSAMNTSVDWVNVPGQFTSLFCVHSAVKSIRTDWYRMTHSYDNLSLEGYGNLYKDVKAITQEVIIQCAQYDTSVDKLLECKKRRRRGDDEEQDKVPIIPPDGFVLIDGPDAGLTG